MSQVFRATPPDATTNILQDNIDQINNDESLRSLFSGTSFPTSPAPVIGQPCYRTDEKLLYIYTADGWVEASQIGSIPNEVKVARGIQNSLNSRLSVSLNDDGSLKSPATANVSEWKETGLAVTRVDGTSFEVDTDQTAIFTKYRKLKVNTESSHVIMHVTDTIYDSINDKTIVYVSEFLPATITSVDYGLVQNSVPAQYVVGPGTSTDGGFAVFDGIDGNRLKNAEFQPIKGPDSSIDGGIAVFDGTDGKSLKVAGSKLSSCYERGSIPSIKGTLTAADRYTWVSPAGGLNVGINGNIYTLTGQVELNLNNSSSWDSISPDYTIAANRAGKDFYVYACQPSSGYAPVLILSANSTYPAGYTADTSRKIGGFHCLCANVGTISGHPLSNFVAGDILPLSVWDLLHRPKTASPEGMVWCPSANIWVDIYLQSGTGSTTASAYGATITDTRTWMDHVDDLGAVGKRLLNDAEFQLIAAGGNEKTNIQGSADPGTTGGHVDTAGRRMISSIGCEDCAGAMWQWLSDQSYRSDGTEWSWKDLPGGKGNIYVQGTYGDVKLLAGGGWADGANCGSRCRVAYYYRWGAVSNNGARGAAEPM